ncbi:ubiquitin-specific protease ubp1 [Diatrype stigma]|uniref:ubiquitinyl hydrolase 1 n=1 Tax=Diatrype stigma TaxID=117547 RepID=A0AAN9UR39_9PEZI
MFPVAKSLTPPRASTYASKSEALRRILGMDRPDSIINTVAHASRKSLSSLSGSTLVKRNVQQPPGLGNYDNSCFQNSILQGLASLTPLPTYLDRALESKSGRTAQDSESSSANSLRNLISELTDSTNNGATLWTPKKLKSLDTWQQQDAQEYFSKILDEIDKEVAKVVKEQYKSPGLEISSVRDDSEDSQHSDDSGYHSQQISTKASSDTKVLRNPLEGLVAQRVACTQCGHSEGLSMIPFNCLTLNLRTDGMRHDLYERLDVYTDLEAIEGVECAKCSLLKVQKLLALIISRGNEVGASDETLREPLARLEAVQLALEEDDFEEKTLKDKCKISAQHRVSSTKTKQVAIARPPQSLAVHMNRSVFDDRTGAMFKNLAPVQFPRTLDLGPWCLGSASGSTTQGVTGSGVGEEELWFSDPRQSMIAGDLGLSKITGPIYELRAVVTHQGKHENGHYVCYRKHPSQPPNLEDGHETVSEELAQDGKGSTFSDENTLVGTEDPAEMDLSPDQKWWRLSDESVWEVSEEQVLAQGGVFMLFYDCVDPNSVLVSEVKAEEKLLSLEKEDSDTATREDEPKTEQGLPDDSHHAKPRTTGEAQREKTSETETHYPSNSVVAGPAFSCLYPLLADGERIDPMIPLDRPNS